MRVENNMLTFRPHVPKEWKSFEFSIVFRGVRVSIKCRENGVELKSNAPMSIQVYNDKIDLDGSNSIVVKTE